MAKHANGSIPGAKCLPVIESENAHRRLQMRRSAAPGLVLLLALLAVACRPSAAEPPDPAASLAQLCGTWTARDHQAGAVVQERWHLDATGLQGDGLTFDAHGVPIAAESMSIQLHASGSTYRAQPAKAASPTDFHQLNTPDPTTWTWINPTHDFPRQIRYQLTDPDHLHVHVEGLDNQDRVHALEWDFVRVQPCD